MEPTINNSYLSIRVLRAQDDSKRFDATSFLGNSTLTDYKFAERQRSQLQTIRSSALLAAVCVLRVSMCCVKHPTQALPSWNADIPSYTRQTGTNFSNFIYTKLPTFASRKIIRPFLLLHRPTERQLRAVHSAQCPFCGLWNPVFGLKNKGSENRPNLTPRRRNLC